MKRRSAMKRPTKKSFYEYMSMRFKTKYKDSQGYDTLLDVIQDADKSEERFMDLAELTLMNKTDRLIYRNVMACNGAELTPLQVDEYLAIVEYGLEYVSQ
jgi:disulfide oxidoreductase YuzD